MRTRRATTIAFADAGHSALPVTVFYVCVRADHHRRRGGQAKLCEHLGCSAYCPAGDVEGHDWMAALTDTARLEQLGMCAPACAEAGTGERCEREKQLVRVR